LYIAESVFWEIRGQHALPVRGIGAFAGARMDWKRRNRARPAHSRTAVPRAFSNGIARTLLIIDCDLDAEHKKRVLWQNPRDLLNLPEPAWAGEAA
jgi:hypothetical protein